jgi:mono/diheme cytochrome c family protein
MSRRRAITAAFVVTAAAAAVAACGEEGIELDAKDRSNAAVERGADLFAQRCSGCHTLSAAGTEGSVDKVGDSERTDGPNFDQRKETVEQVLYAIRNGGFSGAIMPQNIVVGRDAEDVAEFLARYSGRQVKRPTAPQAPGKPPKPTGG